MTGYIAKTKDQVITEINQIFINVLGVNVNLNPSGSNGQFIDNLSNIGVTNENFYQYLTASLYNPEVAQGIWLDSLCSWNGIQRKPATSSRVECVCTGTVGIIIPINTLIQSTNGDIFYAENSITIGAGGTVIGVFLSQKTGAIPCLAGTVNKMITTVIGLDSVNNPTNGVTGQDIQSDNSLRQSRIDLINTYASASVGSLYSNLYKVDNVTDVYVVDNYNEFPITIGGVILSPHSVYMAVIGGADNDIAQVIYQKKSLGCNMVGNTTYNYINPVWGDTFIARWQRPTDVPVQVDVVVSSIGLPFNAVNIIKNAIVDNFNGVDALNPAWTNVKIGQLVNVSRFYDSLTSRGIYNIQSMTIQKVVGGTASVQIQLPINEIASLINANVNVTVV